MKTLYNYKQVNYVACGFLIRFINFLNNFSFISGITEIVIYHINPTSHKGDQMFYYTTLLFDFVNGVVLTILVERLQNSNSFSRELFQKYVSEEVCGRLKNDDSDVINEFLTLLKKMMS